MNQNSNGWIGVVAGVLFCGAFLAAEDLTVPAIPSVPGSEKPRAPIVRIEIDPRFIIGQTYRYVANTKVRAQLPDRGIRTLALEQQARYTVSPREDGKEGVRVEGRTEHLVVALRSAGASLDYDSFEVEDRQSKIGQHLQPGLREGIDILLNRDNRVVESEKEIREVDEHEVPNTLPHYGPEELTQLVALLIQGESKRKVGIGETWTLQGNRPVSGMGDLSFEIRFRHAGTVEYEGHTCERIGLSGALSGILPAKPDGEGMEMRFEGGSLNGEIYYDPVIRTYRFLKQSISLFLETPSATPDSSERQIALEQSTEARLLHRILTP